jgi:hypothetical protein
VFVHIPKILWNKLDPCAKRCVFVGYSDLQKGYRCYDPHTRKVHVTLDASFRELIPYYSGGVLSHSLQGENFSNENKDLMDKESEEFTQLEALMDKVSEESIQLEENEQLNPQGCDQH